MAVIVTERVRERTGTIRKEAPDRVREHRLWVGKIGIDRMAGEPIVASVSLCVDFAELDVAITRAYLTDKPQSLPVLASVGVTPQLMETIAKIEKREQFFKKIGLVRNERRPDEDLVTYHSRILTLPPVGGHVARRYRWMSANYAERIVMANIDEESFTIEDPSEVGRRSYPLTDLKLDNTTDKSRRPMLRCRFDLTPLQVDNAAIKLGITHFPSIDQIAYAKLPVAEISVSVMSMSL